MDRFQYLFVLLAVVLATLPLELAFGVRVWRDPSRLAVALAPVVGVFVVWDLVAVANGTWGFAERYTLGLELPGDLPVEELLFFVVVPVAAILTREVLRTAGRRRRPEAAGDAPGDAAAEVPRTTRVGS